MPDRTGSVTQLVRGHERPVGLALGGLACPPDPVVRYATAWEEMLRTRRSSTRRSPGTRIAHDRTEIEPPAVYGQLLRSTMAFPEWRRGWGWDQSDLTNTNGRSVL
jgi:hypothetical protein